MPNHFFSLWNLVGFSVATLVVLLLIGKVPLRYNLRNLAVRWWLTLLPTLAFTVVIGLLTVMLAFVNGMARLAEGSAHPGNVIVLADGATDELFSNLGFTDVSNVERQVATHNEEGDKLPRPVRVATAERDGNPVFLCSREVYAIANQPIPVPPGEPARRRFVQVRGMVDPEVASVVHGVPLARGRWFEEARGGIQPLPGGGSAVQAVLGESVSRLLAADQDKEQLDLGDMFELAERKWVVVGILQSAGSTFDSEVWARHQIVGESFRKHQYTSIVLSTEGGDAASARLLAGHLTKNFRPAVQAVPESEYYAKLQNTNEQFLWGIRFVAVIMAVGGVSGIMVTMFAAIALRTRDIGVLRILGYARWQILVSFLLETLTIALLGGALGCALGALADGWEARSVLSGGQGGGKLVVLKLVVDADILGVGMLFALAMGWLGGLLPSLSAMWLKPLEAVR